MQLTELWCKPQHSMGGTPDAIAQNCDSLAVQSDACCCLPYCPLPLPFTIFILCPVHHNLTQLLLNICNHCCTDQHIVLKHCPLAGAMLV